MTEKERNELIQKIIEEEKIIQNKNNPKEEVVNAQKRLSKLILSYDLTIEDLIIMDEILIKTFS